MQRIAMLLLGLSVSSQANIVFGNDVASAPAFNNGDTWQVEIKRENQTVSSTATLEGSLEITIMQGQPRIYQIEGGKKIRGLHSVRWTDAELAKVDRQERAAARSKISAIRRPAVEL